MTEDLPSLSYPKEVPHEAFELDLIGDPLFTIGVPAKAPSEFKRMVFAAGKTYVMGNRSVDYMLREYGAIWNVDDAKTHGFHSEYLDICYFVVSHLDGEIIRFKGIKNDDHHGLFAAGSALLRLQTSFRCACFLLRQHCWLELACILKLILEQIAWSYVVRSLQGEVLFGAEPTKTVGVFKKFYSTAGKMYGLLNETSHISPERTIDYLDFSEKHPGVFLSSGQQSARYAYFLLLLVDMYLVTSEFIHADHYQKRQLTFIDGSGNVTLNPKRKLLKHIDRFRKRLDRLSKQYYRPKFGAQPT